jgi:hypothetical protein
MRQEVSNVLIRHKGNKYMVLCSVEHSDFFSSKLNERKKTHPNVNEMCMRILPQERKNYAGQ